MLFVLPQTLQQVIENRYKGDDCGERGRRRAHSRVRAVPLSKRNPIKLYRLKLIKKIQNGTRNIAAQWLSKQNRV